jgi:hypothetical protein
MVWSRYPLPRKSWWQRTMEATRRIWWPLVPGAIVLIFAVIWFKS